MGEFVHCSVCSRPGDWLKIFDCPGLCGRVLSCSNPRCSRDDVADVDSIWYNAWKYHGRGLYECGQ